jgi:hypothetical protein
MTRTLWFTERITTVLIMGTQISMDVSMEVMNG